MRWILDALSTMSEEMDEETNGRKKWSESANSLPCSQCLFLSLSLTPFQMLQTIYFLLTQITWLFRSRVCARARAFFYEYFNDNSDVPHINWIHVQVKVKFIRITKHPLCWCSDSIPYIIVIYLLHIIEMVKRSSSGWKRILRDFFSFNLIRKLMRIFQFLPHQRWFDCIIGEDMHQLEKGNWLTVSECKWIGNQIWKGLVLFIIA